MKMKMRIREIGEMGEIYLSKWLERSITEAIDRNDFDLANGFKYPDTESIVMLGIMRNTERIFEIFPMQQIKSILDNFYNNIDLSGCYIFKGEVRFDLNRIYAIIKKESIKNKYLYYRQIIGNKIIEKLKILEEQSTLLNKQINNKIYDFEKSHYGKIKTILTEKDRYLTSRETLKRELDEDTYYYVRLRNLKNEIYYRLVRKTIIARRRQCKEFFYNKEGLRISELCVLVGKADYPLYIREIKKKISYGKAKQYIDEKDCYVLYNQKIYQLDKFSYSMEQIKELVNSLEVREIQDFVNMSKRTAAIKSGTISPRVEISEEVRQIVWTRDGGRCVRCHTNKKLVYAHIIPHVDGGAATARNIELLCEDCNNKQGANVQYEGDLFQ